MSDDNFKRENQTVMGALNEAATVAATLESDAESDQDDAVLAAVPVEDCN